MTKYSKSGVNLSVCAYCFDSIDDFSRTVDHLYPKSKGGKLSNKNKVPSCFRCNQMKGNLNVEEFFKSLDVIISLEHHDHKKKISLLKKMKKNVQGLMLKKEKSINGKI